MADNEGDMSIRETVELLKGQSYMSIPVDEVLTDLMNRLGVNKLISVIEYLADIYHIE